MVFSYLEPFGGDIQYLGTAIVAATVANGNRGKGEKAYTAAQFVPKFRKPEQSVEEMINFAAMFTAAAGGQDLRPEDTDDGG